MKCINKKRKKAIFLTLAAIILLLFVILAVVLFFNRTNFKEEFPYNKSIQAFGTSAKEDALVAPGLASNLCVGEDFTQMEGIKAFPKKWPDFFHFPKEVFPFPIIYMKK